MKFLPNPWFKLSRQLWISDYGETNTLAYWQDGYVLEYNPDGTITATTKYTSGLPTITLRRVPTMNAEESSWLTHPEWLFKKIGETTVGHEWKPGDIVNVSRPQKYAAGMATGHILRLRGATQAEIVWRDPVSGEEIHTFEDLEHLIFVKHDPGWIENRRYDTFESHYLEIGAPGANPFYTDNTFGYPTEVNPDRLSQPLYFEHDSVVRYLNSQTVLHLGIKQLDDMEVPDLTAGIAPW